jgi:hypothetical protein
MPASAALALWSALAGAQEGHHEHAAGAPEAEEPDLLYRTMMRTASGTAWQPTAAPMYMVHREERGWDVMVHANVFGVAAVQGTRRGDAELVSMNSLMGMVSRDVGRARPGLRVMVSADPLTMGGDGYPLLLQTGETFEGKPIVDRQHPHDVIMEVAGTWQQLLTDEIAVQLYVAPAGEPAIGPGGFPHRASAISDPVAPLSHHWQDATHITYGVVTAGVFTPRVMLEGSAFNGREPDEDRYDLDLRPLDSWSGRVTFSAGEQVVIQGSYAFLESPEATEPDHSVRRVTASAMWSRPLGGDRSVDSSLIWGRNVEGDGEALATDSWLLETNAAVSDAWTLFGRLEHVVKSAHDFDLHDAGEHATFPLPSANLGVVRTVGLGPVWHAGVGLRGNATLLPGTLEETYGTRVPLGLYAYVQVRPAPMRMSGHEGH